MEINEILYGRYAMGQYTVLLTFDSLLCVLTWQRMLKLSRWDIDHATARERLLMRIIHPSVPNPTKLNQTEGLHPL
jgi:hypothetical protein